MSKESMTSRERVLRAINHQPVDRMPIDLGSHMSTGISMFAYWHLREYLGLSTDQIWTPDMVQALAYVDVDILERFHCDCILLEPRFPQTIRWNPRDKYHFTIPAAASPQLLEDGSWVIRRGEASMHMPQGGFFFDGQWLNDWGQGAEDDRISLYSREAERIYKETDYATNLVGYSHGLGFSDFGAGSIDHAILAHDDPATFLAIQEARLVENLRRMGRVIDSFGKYVQMVTLADDMGSQNGPMCSPAYIEKFCMPYYRKFCEFVHTNSDIKVFFHCCGAIKPLIPQIIAAGFDILNPIQISANTMDPAILKAEFGNQICFWGGGCDTQHVLGVATSEQVAENVRHLVGILKPNGGFVFNQVHNIMGNVPPKNIVAMLDTAYAESFYD